MQYSFTRPSSPPPYTESDHRGPQHVPGHDPDFWFEDGNIVVIADGTSFRIHRSVLARHSDVLVDRLGSDQGHRENTSDGCPVIRVTDSARSFKGLLSLLYPGPSEVLRQAAASERVPALARVTHKYLHSLLPSTFDEWRRREERTASSGPASAHTHPSAHSSGSENMISVLNALRQIQGDDLLPIALYLCARLPPRVLLSGRRACDGAVETLSGDDAELCLLLREAMAKHSARMAMRLFADAPDPRCPCRRAVEETFAAVVNGEFEDAPRTDPLGAYWRRYIDRVERGARGDKRMCSRCAYALRQRELEQRRELWDELPRLVGF